MSRIHHCVRHGQFRRQPRLQHVDDLLHSNFIHTDTGPLSFPSSCPTSSSRASRWPAGRMEWGEEGRGEPGSTRGQFRNSGDPLIVHFVLLCLSTPAACSFLIHLTPRFHLRALQHMSTAAVRWFCSECKVELEDRQPQHTACHRATKWTCPPTNFGLRLVQELQTARRKLCVLLTRPYSSDSEKGTSR